MQIMRNILILSVLFIFSILPVAMSGVSEENKKSSNLISVAGQIIDNESGEALSGVLVKIEEAGNRIYTDLEGKFEISNLVTGNYRISVSFISYENRKLNLELNGEENGPLKIQLNQVGLK